MSADAGKLEPACGRCVQDYCCPLAAVKKESDEWRAEAERLRVLLLKHAVEQVERELELEDGL